MTPDSRPAKLLGVHRAHKASIAVVTTLLVTTLLVATLLVAAPSLFPTAAQAAPPRIVALTPFTANTLVKLGIRPVGVGQTLGGNDRLSPKLEGVPVLPLSHPNGPTSSSSPRSAPT